MIATYRGIIRDGKVELQGVALPEGAEVVVVVETYLSLQEQETRYNVLSDEEWAQPFVAYRALATGDIAEAQVGELTDEALTTLIHESRVG